MSRQTRGCWRGGESALREIEDWHQRLTRFEPDSWLSHVNRTAAHEPVRLDDEMFPLFADAVAVWRDSGGAFDIARGDGAAVMLDARRPARVRFLHDHVALDHGRYWKRPRAGLRRSASPVARCDAAHCCRVAPAAAWLSGGRLTPTPGELAWRSQAGATARLTT